ncbi:MAG TPA: DNA methyltransferase [Ignavibacteria bacterium]
MNVNITQVEKNIHKLLNKFNKEKFIFDLLLAYGIPKATIKRLQKSGLNLSKETGEVIWKKKLFFKEELEIDLHFLIDGFREDERVIKYDTRFIVVTDNETILAIDRKNNETLDIPINKLTLHFDFFLPLAGLEKTINQTENPADVKASERMAKLYDEIKKHNSAKALKEVHNINVFLSRLLFCFFAEDTEIFEKNLFTNSINSHTQPDGSDLNKYLNNLFEVLNAEQSERKNLPVYLDAFPFVNGGLFKNKISTPLFTKRSRQILLECGELDWSAINPDIFGSMIQAVVRDVKDDDNTKHYTSVPNIMKVIEPLFLNELNEEYESSKNEPRRLNKLLDRIEKIKIFDPACGSGNFLIIAYKELRLLEIKILQQLDKLQKAATNFEPLQTELIPKAQLTLAAAFKQSFFSRIKLTQFYGIELDDFAHEIAILSMWLAEHQMNMKFKEVFGSANPTLPLKASGNIVRGNATRLDWKKVCPKKDKDELFVLGNPPYLGARVQDVNQKSDMDYVFKGFKKYKDLDYIACWFYKGAIFIKDSNAKLAFVSTNSICQGDQVALLWPNIFAKKIEIFFAVQSFKWTNNAKYIAGVSVIIVGLANLSNYPKYIFINQLRKQVTHINAYLIDGSNVIIERRHNSLSLLKEMPKGNMPYDGGNLIFSKREKEEYARQFPKSIKYFKRLIGANEFLDNIERWCLWITDNQLKEASTIKFISDRIQKVNEIRLSSTDEGANKLAQRSHQFREINTTNTNSIIIPLTTSERREYLPIGFINSYYIVTNAISVIYDAEAWYFSILSSRIHLVWIRAVCGSLETRIRYSSVLGYNTFPFPSISEIQKQELERNVYRILEEREIYSEKTLAQLYDPEKMPKGLKEAHHQLDLAVERCYRSKPFESDEERLEYLFKLYERMIEDEKEQSGQIMFEVEKPKRKK